MRSILTNWHDGGWVSKFYACDHCFEVINEDEIRHRLVDEIIKGVQSTGTQSWDLCNECKTTFVTWIKEYQPE